MTHSRNHWEPGYFLISCMCSAKNMLIRSKNTLFFVTTFFYDAINVIKNDVLKRRCFYNTHSITHNNMAVTTLQQVFGTNATQTATTVSITKADLASTGFTPSANNTADSLLAAIVAFAETNIPDSAVTGGNTSQTIGIADGYQQITTIGTSQYLVLPKTLNFYSAFSGTFNPNNY